MAKQPDLIEQISPLIEAKEWSKVLEIIKHIESKRVLSDAEKLREGLALFNTQEMTQGFEVIESTNLEDYKDCTWLRRMLVAPLIRSSEFAWAASVLRLIIDKHPESVLDLSTLSSVLIRQNKRSEATSYLEKILLTQGNHASVAAQLIQIKLQNKELNQAAELALRYEKDWVNDTRLAHMSLLALSRTKQLEPCIRQLQQINLALHTADFCLISVQIAFDAKEIALAQKLIEICLKLGHQDARLYLLLAKIKLIENENHNQSIELLTQAHKIDPNNLQVNALLGELLLKMGSFEKAQVYLEKGVSLSTENPNLRMLYARALKFSGQFDQAADEMLKVIEFRDGSNKLKRYAASALIQAGRTKEAITVFESGVNERIKHLPISFSAGLQKLRDQVEDTDIPQVRFDWLWQIVSQNQTYPTKERLAYEKAARWGHKVDHFLLDWLECKPHLADEAMVYLSDLTELEQLTNQIMEKGKGMIFASAHIGLMYVGPLALELLGIPNKWLASTPSISSMPYTDSLISTSESTESQVVRRVLKFLNSGGAVTIAVDGAMNPSAPRIDFEGQQITFSDFAARMSHRTQAPSVFAVPYWGQSGFEFELRELPFPYENEDIELFCLRWRSAFLLSMKEFLVKRPENARLSGGVWRHIK